MHLLNTLYVNTQDSYLRLDNQTRWRVLVDDDERKLACAACIT